MSEENVEQVAQPEAGGTMLETPAEVAQGGSGNDFLSTIPEELRDHPSLSPIKDVENLARSYVNAQKLIGADKIPMPVNPTDEDLDRIYGRLGRPETAEGYEIPVDGNIVTEEVAKDYANVAHKLRLSPQQASGILEYYQSLAGQSEETMAAANPAKINPLTPAGIKFFINHGAALSFAKFPAAPIKPGSTEVVVNSPVSSKFITYAMIPGKTTITGIINFRNAANAIPF